MFLKHLQVVRVGSCCEVSWAEFEVLDEELQFLTCQDRINRAFHLAKMVFPLAFEISPEGLNGIER